MTREEVEEVCIACSVERDEEMTREACVLYGIMQTYRAGAAGTAVVLCGRHGYILQSLGATVTVIDTRTAERPS